MKNGTTPICIDNTNIRKSEMKSYVRLVRFKALFLRPFQRFIILNWNKDQFRILADIVDRIYERNPRTKIGNLTHAWAWYQLVRNWRGYPG